MLCLIFFEILQNCHVFFGIHSGFIPTFLEIDGQYISTIPNLSAENFFYRTVEMNFFWCWLTFFMPNLTVFFLCQGDLKNPQLITLTILEIIVSRVYCAKHFRLCRLMFIYSHQSTVRVHISHTLFCNFQQQNVLYSHMRNFDIVFVYQQIPNFTNREHSVTFENCEHHKSHFIRRSVI